MKLTMANRLKVLATGSVDQYINAFISGADIRDGPVDTEMAMKYSAVNACIRILAETFASTPMILYKKNEKGREPVTDLPAYDILHNRPNEEMSPFSFDEARTANLCVSGNSVCEKLVNKKGELVGLYPYPHDIVDIKRNKQTGRLEYRIGGHGDTRDKLLRRDQVLHVPNMSFDGVIGQSPISYAAESIRLGLSYEKYGVKFYQNAATPSGVFESPDKLTDVAFTRLQKGLKEQYTGLEKSGTPMLLEEGMKWKQTTISPADAQLLESKYFQIEDICRIYRVPQHLVNKLDRSTFSNIEHLSLEFVMYTMLPYFKRDEGCINAQILTPKQRDDGYYFERKIDGLLRGDQESRAKAHAQGRQWGWLSVNDISRLENRPNIGPKGDIYLQPSNMIEAGSDDQAAAQNSAKLLEDIYAMISERR